MIIVDIIATITVLIASAITIFIIESSLLLSSLRLLVPLQLKKYCHVYWSPEIVALKAWEGFSVEAPGFGVQGMSR